ncbi:hypothetical protein EYF80_008547 [Liparis tanakae]|uniref:Uncharacterized protein n=1 Tax=Liparis tanakae TaxID=230148 RepID=A0A4Z2IVG1_9TELE|nr:hypothetical protein EYF80_008547 [Liparis tanakae]
MAAEVKGQPTGVALMRWEPSNWKSTLEIRGGIVQRGTYVKTKNSEVEPTRRPAAVHTGTKALGFSESAPLTGILSSAHSSESHRRQVPARCSRLVRTEPGIHLRALEKHSHGQEGRGRR